MKKRFISILTVAALLFIGFSCNSRFDYYGVSKESPLITPVVPDSADEASYPDLDDLHEDLSDFTEFENYESGADALDGEYGSDSEDVLEDDDFQTEPIEIVIEYISEFDSELFEQLNSTASRFNAAAVSLAVFDGEHHFYTYQFGYANINERRLVDVETRFRVASLSKITTALVAMILAENDMLDLDEDISTYFGTIVRSPGHPDTPITARMLMQHTSSIVDSGTFRSSRADIGTGEMSTLDLLEMSSTYSGRMPGRSFIYTNFGFSVLAAICELASSTSFDMLARELIFEPLGIDAAYMPKNLSDTENIAGLYNANRVLSRSVPFQLSVGTSGILGFDHHLAQGNLTISALDYARILAMLASGGILGETRILSEESVREIHYADIAAGAFMQGLAVRFGESSFMGMDVYWHTGSAVGEFAQFVYCLEENRGVVVLTTGANGDRLPNTMLRVCTELAELVWDIGVSEEHLDGY